MGGVLVFANLTDDIQDRFVPSRRSRRLSHSDCLRPPAVLPRRLGGPSGVLRIRQKNWLIHGAEPGQILLAAPNANETQLDMGRFPEQLG